ncbi:SAG family member [Eimeria tenella]|uniref:SAG family member n=1 Tax=Eimeria tenella TaxID=5802 RepID=U6KVJ6_EIMTE|nr:SAG family member [Eimeria tenella]CDJ41981.1 SAG family member [Eimeria tenella]|eukprot:XP_013232731.1 SAG family member [Eimeria tenella]
MIYLAFIALAAVTVFCGHKAEGASITGTAKTLNCLAAMNEARTAAGLAEFKPAAEQGQMLPENPAAKSDIRAADLWEEICQEIAGSDSDGVEAQKLKGTFLYYPGEDDCAAAVQYWKDGFSLFNNKLPPMYKVLGKPEVYTNKAVSFVALYNPKADPVASCAFVTCTKGDVFTAAALSKSHGGPALRRLSGEKPTTALICLTNPEAFTADAAPFKEEEWQKIVHAIVGPEASTGAARVRPACAAHG